MTSQCKLLKLRRSSVYYQPVPISEHELALMRELDAVHMKYPYYGSRRIYDELNARGYPVCRKKVQRLMRKMGIIVLYPKQNTSQPGKGHKVYPYLLKDLSIERPNHVWATDISYIPMARGFLYLMAIMDWHSPKVLSYRLSNTMDVHFCLEALEEALQRHGKPEIFNSDQSAQFTREAFAGLLKAHEIKISMDGRGRWVDNVFIERLWCSLKYEEAYLKAYQSPREAETEIGKYFDFYNSGRRHQGLNKLTPDQVYFDHQLKQAA